MRLHCFNEKQYADENALIQLKYNISTDVNHPTGMHWSNRNTMLDDITFNENIIFRWI